MSSKEIWFLLYVLMLLSWTIYFAIKNKKTITRFPMLAFLYWVGPLTTISVVGMMIYYILIR